MRYILLGLLLPLAFSRGCNCQGSRGGGAAPSAARPTSAPAIAARLDAARQIAGVAERDDALGKVAADAAAQGDVDVASRSLEAMSDVTAHDEAAAKCARTLAKAGNPAGATEIAKAIRGVTRRDATLAEIAKEPHE
jgi:hypothetical protein